MRSAEVSRELVEYVAAARRGNVSVRAGSRLWRRSFRYEVCHRRPCLSRYPAAERAAARLLLLRNPKSTALWVDSFEREQAGLPPF